LRDNTFIIANSYLRSPSADSTASLNKDEAVMDIEVKKSAGNDKALY